MTLNELFKNTTYDDTLFSAEAKSAIESRIFMKSVRGSEVPHITCAIRNKEIKLTPEEAVRQLYIYKLMNEYGYAASRIQLETPIHFGREVKRADIAIMDKDRPMVPYIIVELKKPKLTDGKEQLKSYCNATGAPIGVWTNGEQISCYNRKDPNFFEEISDIPKASQKLSDIINEKFTYEDLKRKDKISTQKKSLRSLIKEMEDEVLASAGVDSFEEIFKLIFAKLYDELICANDPTAYLQFRNNGNTDYELKEKIQGLFDDAKKKWEGIFTDESKILLSPSHLAVCVASLQDIKLFNNNLDVVDDAFEYLMSKAQKGEKGQYFTPRYVIDMCVKMMNPTTKDKIIDTACGSSGFTVHSIFKVWKDIRREKGLPEGDGFTAAERIPEETNFVRDNVFAIDFDEKTVRVARTLNLIAGDGQTIVSYFIPFIRSIFIDELLYTTNTNADVMDLHQIKLICHIYNTTFYNVMTNEYIYWDDDLLSNGEFASAIENDHIYAIGTTWNGASEAESWLQMMQESKKNCSKSFSIFLYNIDGYAISDNVSSDVYVAGPVTGIYEVILAFVSGQDMRPFKNWSGLCEITHKPMNFSIYGWMVDLTGVFIVDGWQVITPPAAYAYYRCDNNDVDPKSTI